MFTELSASQQTTTQLISVSIAAPPGVSVELKPRFRENTHFNKRHFNNITVINVALTLCEQQGFLFVSCVWFKLIVSFNCSAAWMLARTKNSSQVYKEQTYNPSTGRHHVGKTTEPTRIGPCHGKVRLSDRHVWNHNLGVLLRTLSNFPPDPSGASSSSICTRLSVGNSAQCLLPPPMSQRPNYCFVAA